MRKRSRKVYERDQIERSDYETELENRIVKRMKYNNNYHNDENSRKLQNYLDKYYVTNDQLGDVILRLLNSNKKNILNKDIRKLTQYIKQRTNLQIQNSLSGIKSFSLSFVCLFSLF